MYINYLFIQKVTYAYAHPLPSLKINYMTFRQQWTQQNMNSSSIKKKKNELILFFKQIQTIGNNFWGFNCWHKETPLASTFKTPLSPILPPFVFLCTSSVTFASVLVSFPLSTTYYIHKKEKKKMTTLHKWQTLSTHRLKHYKKKK